MLTGMVITPDDNLMFLKQPHAIKRVCCCSRQYRYTLEPLRANIQASLVCSDIDGIYEIRLIELQFYWGGPFGEIEIRKSKNYLASMNARNKTIPDNVALSSAIFTIKFEGIKLPRTVQIRPPLVAAYEKEADRKYVEQWLRNRGFLTSVVHKNANQPEKIMEHV
jgi:hypothetical protein